VVKGLTSLIAPQPAGSHFGPANRSERQERDPGRSPNCESIEASLVHRDGSQGRSNQAKYFVVGY